MKKQSINWIKKLKSLSLLSFFSFLLVTGVNSQSISFNLLQQPCNADGQLEFTVSGVNFPCNVNIYYAGTGTNTNYTLNTATDVINFYSGEEVYVYATDGVNGAWNSFSAPPFTYTVSTSPAICPSLTGIATVTISGGLAPYNFDWIEDSNPALVVATGNPANLIPGGYAVTITDANGCIFSSNMGGDSIFVWSQSGMTVNTSSTPANCTNGTAQVTSVTGGISPYTYLWSNGATTTSINGLVNNSYTVTVTDAQGCYETGYTYISQAITINVNPVTSAATCLQNDGSVITFGSGGTPPYSYQYSNNATTQSVNGLVAGNYSVVVTDANGCSGNGWFNIAASTPVTATYNVTPSSCTVDNGGATLNINGGTSPYTVNWSVFPTQTGSTLSAVGQGNYAFYISDAVGCIQNGMITVPTINPLYASISNSNTMCNTNNGTATVNAWGGTSPYSYSWSTGSTNTSISGLTPGGYSCTIIDAAGCTKVKSAYVQSISPISIGFSTTPATCIFNADGNVTTNIFGGQAPYTVSWSNGGTGSTISNLAAGNYYVYVTDANGCTKTSFVHVPYDPIDNSCYCRIEGIVYEDVNGNCVQDAGENGIENIMINCTGNGYDFTDYNGYYSFIVPSGTYTVSQIVQAIYPLAACQSNNNIVTVTSASGCVNTIDFANTVTPLHDIFVLNTAYTPPVPGNVFSQYTIVQNNGTISESNIQLSYKHDGQLGFTGSGNVSYTQLDPTNEPNWYSVQSALALSPGASYTIINNFMTPANIPLGTSIYIRDTTCYQSPVSDWVNDYTPWNNIHTFIPQVMGSFDPNYKEVSPRGEGTQGNITRADEYLNYVVHFQNTGSWPAQLVVISDTLDPDLDQETLVPGWSDHNYTASVDNNGVLTFRFENINLPDSASNPTGSMGLVSYSIKVKDNLPAGTEISNTAGIYFDYNAPVITNTTLNTITDSLLSSFEMGDMDEWNAIIYPNPAHDDALLMISSGGSDVVYITFSDISGKVISEKKVILSSGRNLVSFQTGQYESGMYFVTIRSSDKIKTVSLIKN